VLFCTPVRVQYSLRVICRYAFRYSNGLAFVQLPAGGFVGERNGDAPLGGRAVESDDKLALMTSNRSSDRKQHTRQFMRHVIRHFIPLCAILLSRVAGSSLDTNLMHPTVLHHRHLPHVIIHR
jgi:hypothetical protein